MSEKFDATMHRDGERSEELVAYLYVDLSQGVDLQDYVQRAKRPGFVRAVVAVVVVLSVWSCVANLAVARQYQDEHGTQFFELKPSTIH